MYGDSRFLSSRLAFLSLLGGRAGVVLVYLHFVLDFGSLTQGLDFHAISALNNLFGIYGP